MELVELSAGDYALTIAPEIGGSLQSFTWRGEPLMRTATGPSVLDAACFPLVPFSNRIANGRFEWEGREVQLSPNFPGFDHPHPLHGFGWTSPWEVIGSDGSFAEIEHRYPGGEWPWPYVARQSLRLTAGGLVLGLSVTNLGDSVMPAGLGFHPYFPCSQQTVLNCLHKGEWQTGTDGLPRELIEAEQPVDWWDGKPAAARVVDRVYADRAGSIRIDWPERALGLSIECSAELAHTAIFVPEGEGWFCVEPVTHPTNALNLGSGQAGMQALAPLDTVSAQVTIAAR